MDASYVAWLAVGLVSRFAVSLATGSDWKFLRCDPYPGGCGAPVYEFTPIGQNETGKDLYAVLYGDVTGNWLPAGGGGGGGGSVAALPKGTSPEEKAAIAADREIGARLRQEGRATPVERKAGAAPAELSLNGWQPLRARERRQVTLDLRNAEGILGLDLVLRYDPARFSIVQAEPVGIGSELRLATPPTFAQFLHHSSH